MSEQEQEMDRNRSRSMFSDAVVAQGPSFVLSRFKSNVFKTPGFSPAEAIDHTILHMRMRRALRERGRS
ncbi:MULTISPECIES: hypothetical protein [Pseudomonas]|uniref:Uncharacterized protein n=1 Tax=Pseudomonas fluorescens LMG 5329 TaxID=1324332 RepID=A0A0A1YWB0_PSEFL|nr:MULTISPECIES: hypothetical protein [Pseudomonas]KGE66330.1 hypothetical protein K814_0119500 [Pseudomonas fluorescens LMG 5329]NLT91268.1 hypothetical protein [Pseudomonas lactis]NWE05060.1 hypothetical protein [Pseudomonas sp. IPO3749]NWF22171.1 hypothetical protein [Pseudomonas sp. IPO3749]